MLSSGANKYLFPPQSDTVVNAICDTVQSEIYKRELLYPPISCLSMPSSQCSLAVERLMVRVGLLFTTVMEALDSRSSVTWTTIY